MALFVVLIAVIVVLIMINSFLPSEVFTSTADGVTIANNARSALPSFDYIIPLGFIGVFIGSIILAFSIPANPSLFWINVLLLFVLVILSVPLANTAEDLSNNADFDDANKDLGITYWWMSKLPLISTLFSAILFIVMLGLNRSSGSEGGGGF